MKTCDNCDHKKVCHEVAIGAGLADGISECADWSGWIPITSRPITEEERKENGWDEDITHIFTCQLPDDGDEILISRNKGKWRSVVEFYTDDYSVGDSDGNDWLYEVEAWREWPAYEGSKE